MGKKKHKKRQKALAREAAARQAQSDAPSAPGAGDSGTEPAPVEAVSRETSEREGAQRDGSVLEEASTDEAVQAVGDESVAASTANPVSSTAWPTEPDGEAAPEDHESPASPTPPPATPTAPRRAVSRETLPRPVAAPRVLVVANQKGGVGKTTTAVNVAAALALGGLRVLLIDLDPQGNASTALGVEHGPDVAGTYEALIDGQDIADLVRPSPEADTLQVLPASIHLAGAEIQLVGMVAREGKLAKAIRRYVRDHDVDYVFLDCPPSLGLLTVNALVAADEIMIPIQCEYYALEGVSQLMNTIALVKGELNDELQLSTVLLTMFDARTRLAAQVAEEVRTHFADETLASVIPRSVRISEAPSYGRTVMTYDPESTGARSYHAAAAEIAHRGARR